MLPDVPLGSTRITGKQRPTTSCTAREPIPTMGKKRPVQPGDITFCADGSTHGLENTGTEDLVFMALIING